MIWFIIIQLIIIAFCWLLVRSRTKALYAGRRKAEKENRAKSRFLSMVSHDIRSPMNGVMGMIELMRLRKLDDELAADVDILHQSAKALIILIEELLEISKIESGMFKPVEHEFSLTKLCEDINVLFGKHSRKHNTTLLLELDPQLAPFYLGDAHLLRRVITNLVDNAIKYTRDGTVTLKVVKNGNNSVEIRVKDTGEGMAPDLFQKVLGERQRGESSEQIDRHGLGMGLTLCQEILNVLGTILQGQSKRGEGTELYFSLQIKECAGNQDAAAVNYAHELPHGKGHILLAEDNDSSAMAISRILQTIGLTVDVVASGQAAIEMCMANTYDGILMDCNLDDGEGYLFARVISDKLSRLSKTAPPMVALSGDVSDEARQKCLAAGMKNLLAKPVSIEQLVAGLTDDMGICLTRPEADNNKPEKENNLKARLLKMALDDVQVAEQLGGQVLNDLDDLLTRLKKAVENQNHQECSKAIHALKDVAAIGGLKDMNPLCNLVSNHAKQGNFSLCRPILEQMDGVVAGVEEQFKQLNFESL